MNRWIFEMAVDSTWKKKQQQQQQQQQKYHSNIAFLSSKQRNFGDAEGFVSVKTFP